MTVDLLEGQLRAARKRLEAVAAPLAHIDFTNKPEQVGRWLREAADAASRRDFVLQDDDRPETLYLWMNDFPHNPDRWFLAAFGNGPERAAESDFDWRDALIGDEIGGGLRVPDLTMTGMELVQTWFAQHDANAPEWSAVVDVVLMAAFDLVARSLPHAGTIPFRLAMSRSEDWQVCIWHPELDRGLVHTWQSRDE